MVKQLIITATVLAASVSTAFATTIVGSATLSDTATVIPGTVSPTTYLSYVSGGDGLIGFADGLTYGGIAGTAASAIAIADHDWLQYDSGIVMYSVTAINSVIAIPAIDHGWTSDNTGEFWEPFEFRIFGCTSAALTSCEEGHITAVWTKGVDDSGPRKNADDWTNQWGFNNSYNHFLVTSGDRLVGGYYSPGEGEIDALAVGVPEPASLLLLGFGLAGLAAWRRKHAA